jgi:hypothetical protein
MGTVARHKNQFGLAPSKRLHTGLVPQNGFARLHDQLQPTIHGVLLTFLWRGKVGVSVKCFCQRYQPTKANRKSRNLSFQTLARRDDTDVAINDHAVDHSSANDFLLRRQASGVMTIPASWTPWSRLNFHRAKDRCFLLGERYAFLFSLLLCRASRAVTLGPSRLH